jgi:RHS repeat-associated protein
MSKTCFIWDPIEDNVVKELDGVGTVVAEYTTEPGLYGNVISQNRGGVESQFHYDAPGSTLAVTDDNQNVTDTRAYTAFGELTGSTGSTTFALQYIGRMGYWRDAETGSYTVRRRIFGSPYARWLSIDMVNALTIGDAYWYCRNSPLTRVDPSGLVVVSMRPPTPISMDWYDWVYYFGHVAVGQTVFRITVSCVCEIHARRRCSLSCFIGLTAKICINRTLIDCLNGVNLGNLTPSELEACLELRRAYYELGYEPPTVEGTYGHEQRHVGSIMARLNRLKAQLAELEDDVNRQGCCESCLTSVSSVSTFATGAICGMLLSESHPKEKSKQNPSPSPEGGREYPPYGDSCPPRPRGIDRCNESTEVVVNGSSFDCLAARPLPPKPPTRPPL